MPLKINVPVPVFFRAMPLPLIEPESVMFFAPVSNEIVFVLNAPLPGTS